MTGKIQHCSELLAEFKDTLSRGAASLRGVNTGFGCIDSNLRGFKPGALTVLAARPSMGKTFLALNIVTNIALGRSAPDQPGCPVGVFCPELTASDLVRRMVCCHAGVPQSHICDGFISSVNMARLNEAEERLREMLILFDDSPGIDIHDLRDNARQMTGAHGVSLILIDSLQSVHARELVHLGRQAELAYIALSLKQMARELDVPVLVVSQLSRGAELRGGEECPLLSDLDKFGITRVADVVMFLRRPSRITGSSRYNEQNLVIMDIAMNRNGPSMIELELHFDGTTGRFCDPLDNNNLSKEHGNIFVKH